MHEYALAESVIAAAVSAAKDRKLARVKRLSLRIGELQRLDMEAFQLGLSAAVASGGPLVRGVEVRYRPEEAAFACRACRREWTFAEAKAALGKDEAEFIHFVPEVAHSCLRCPGCAGPDFEVTRGRGVWLESVEGEAGP